MEAKHRGWPCLRALLLTLTLLLSPLLGLAGATPALAAPSCDTSGATTTCTFDYTGAAESWTVPAGVTSVTVQAFGGQGARGNGGFEPGAGPAGGNGGAVTATIGVAPGEALAVFVGGAGVIGGAGGFNGGGAGAQGINPRASGGGGGASDVRQGGAALANRVVVAGGGGGGGGGSGRGGPGGAGGGLTGAAGADAEVSRVYALGGGGGTQMAGGAGGAGDPLAPDGISGALGIGGAGGLSPDSTSGGGGGGGYYGGGGGEARGTGTPSAGGGGGSSFAIGTATGVTHQQGVRTGEGQVIISYTQAETTAPTATPSQEPAANGAGWNNSDVTVSWNWSDGGSGIDSASCTTTSTSSGEGEQALSASCTDLAGNQGSASYTVKVDTSAPVVSVTGVTNGASYLLGAVPAAACSTTDALSGVATQATLALAGGTLAGTGSFTASCAGASDRASNSAAPVSVSYTVASVVVTRHAPSLNSGSRVEGPLWLLSGEDTTINGGVVAGDLLVPGSPTVVRNGGTIGSTVSGSGSATPSGYRLTLNSGASVTRLVTRTDPVALPSVPTPPTPSGTRDVQVNSAGQSLGNLATIRNLTLNSNAGAMTLPAGTYGKLTANSGTSFVLGVAGASASSVYNLQGLTLNGGRLQIVGPVVINLASGFSLNSSAVIGGQSEWLMVNVATGAVTLNTNTSFFGTLRAPSSTVTLNSGARLEGTLLVDRLVLNGGTVRATP